MSSVFTDPITGATSISGSLTVDNINIRGMSLGSVTLSSNAIWLPSTSLQWTPVVAPNLPTFNIPDGGTMTYSRRNGVYRWIGNDVSYNINVAGLLNTQSTVTTGDYTLNVPYPINVAAYGANALIGELWLTTYYQTNSNSFKAYARTIASDANNVTIRVLTGTADVTLTTALSNTTMILQGTMTYNTSSFNQVGGVPAAYLPAAFYQNAAGQVLLNSNVVGGVVAPRGQLDIVYNSNLPAVVIDQLGTGDALQVKDGGVTQFVVDGTGNVGIGMGNPLSKLHVNGDSLIGGVLKANRFLSPATNITNLNVTPTDSKVLLYDYGGANWSGIGVDGNGCFWIRTGSSSTNIFSITNNGYVGIGEPSPGTNLHIRSYANSGPAMRYQNANYTWGTGVGTSEFYVYNASSIGTYLSWGSTSWSPNGSDERIKQDIKPLQNALNIVNKLEPVTFKYKVDLENTHHGFIAQNIEKVLPSEVIKNEAADNIKQYLNGEDKVKTYNSEFLIPYLVKSIQELHLQVLNLTEKINNLSNF